MLKIPQINKYSFIAVLIASIIGFSTGAVFTVKQKNQEIVKLVNEYEASLKEQDAKAQATIVQMQAEIKEYQALLERDAIKIKDLQYKIKVDGIKYQQKLKEIQNLTPDEKTAWFINRYSTRSDK